MKLSIIGAPHFVDWDRFKTIMDKLKPKISLLILGGSLGVDKLAERWAKENAMKALVIYPDLTRADRQGFDIRNREMLKEANRALFFWDGRAKGTETAIEHADEIGIRYKVFTF